MNKEVGDERRIEEEEEERFCLEETMDENGAAVASIDSNSLLRLLIRKVVVTCHLSRISRVKTKPFY